MRSHFAHFTCCWPDTPLCHHLSSDCECKFSGYILVPSRLFQVFSGFPGTKVDWPDTFLCHHSSSSCCRLQMLVLQIYFGPTSTISGFKGSTSVFSFRVEQVCTFHLLTCWHSSVPPFIIMLQVAHSGPIFISQPDYFWVDLLCPSSRVHHPGLFYQVLPLSVRDSDLPLLSFWPLT